MQSFEYYTPTRVLFGKDTELEVGKLVAAQGCKKALVHFGGGSAKRNGLLDRIFASLDSAGVSYISLGGVVPNPRLSLVREGIELCKNEGVDFLLAVGGGSVLDSAKAIGYGLVYDGDVWDLYSGKSTPTGAAPVGAVLTISAAGSEMSNSSVITNDEDGWLKKACNTEYIRCKFAIMNPELTYTLPPYQTASGCVDILMHTLERYFVTGDTSELTDGIAEHLLRVVMKNCKIALADPENYKARAEIMWAGSLSHNDLTGCGNGQGDFASHLIEHELGGMFDVAHGAGLAAVWGAWARYVCNVRPSRFAQLARNVMDSAEKDDEKAALKGIAAFEDFFRSVDMPVSVGGMGLQLTEEKIDEMAEKCTQQGTKRIGGFKKLEKADIVEIFRRAR